MPNIGPRAVVNQGPTGENWRVLRVNQDVLLDCRKWSIAAPPLAGGGVNQSGFDHESLYFWMCVDALFLAALVASATGCVCVYVCACWRERSVQN